MFYVALGRTIYFSIGVSKEPFCRAGTPVPMAACISAPQCAHWHSRWGGKPTIHFAIGSIAAVHAHIFPHYGALARKPGVGLVPIVPLLLHSTEPPSRTTR